MRKTEDPKFASSRGDQNWLKNEVLDREYSERNNDFMNSSS